MTEGYVFAGPGRDRIIENSILSENTGRKSAQRKGEAIPLEFSFLY